MKKLFSNPVLRGVIFIVAGIILSGASFLAYLYPEEKLWAVIIVLSVLDLGYTLLNAYVFLEEVSDGRLVKSILLTLGHLVVFNALPAGYMLIKERFGEWCYIWQDILFYSFFAGAMLIIIIIIVSLLMIFINFLRGQS